MPHYNSIINKAIDHIDNKDFQAALDLLSKIDEEKQVLNQPEREQFLFYALLADSYGGLNDKDKCREMIGKLTRQISKEKILKNNEYTQAILSLCVEYLGHDETQEYFRDMKNIQAYKIILENPDKEYILTVSHIISLRCRYIDLIPAGPERAGVLHLSALAAAKEWDNETINKCLGELKTLDPRLYAITIEAIKKD